MQSEVLIKTGHPLENSFFDDDSEDTQHNIYMKINTYSTMFTSTLRPAKRLKQLENNVKSKTSHLTRANSACNESKRFS